MKSSLFLAVFLLTMAVNISAFAKGKVPEWVSVSMNTQLTEADNFAEAVKLYHWARLDYSTPGTEISVTRGVIRINSLDARDRAKAVMYFSENGDKVKWFNCWLIQPDGEVLEFDKSDARIASKPTVDLYSEGKTIGLDLSDSVKEGSVFAYEGKKTSKTVFTQSIQRIHSDIPVKHLLLEVIVSNGWTVTFTEVNNPEGEMSQSGNTFRWEAQNPTPFIDEPSGPGYYDSAGFLGVGISPKKGFEKNSKIEIFSDWEDVANYGVRMINPMAIANSAIREKANTLCSNAESTWDRIMAIAKFAQSINYVSISEGANWGGGHKPFSAETVFERRYGDCKDMSSLTIAMLESVGIESYAVMANGPNRLVKEEWASPYQFNHCIVGIKVDQSIDCEAVFENSELGRILIFDPTLQELPVGDMPYYIGDTKVLIVAPEAKTLQHLPAAQMKNNLIKQTVEYTVESDGTIFGKINESYHGGAALFNRSNYRNMSSEDYEDMERNWLAEKMRDVRIKSLNVDDRFDDSQMDIAIEFEAPHYARSIGGKMLVFQPTICYRTEKLAPSGEERKTPYKLGSKNVHLNSTIKIPNGFIIEEMGTDLNIESKFGHYVVEYTKGENELIVDIKLQVYYQDVSPEDYPDFVKFSKKILKADQTPVLLMKI